MPRLNLKQRSLLPLLAVIIGIGFAVSSLASYYMSRETIRKGIIGVELPLTADVISGEIQKDLVRLVQVSSAMAQDPFVLDWLDHGEANPALISRYLQAIQQRYDTSTAFFASRVSETYYTDTSAQTMQPSDTADGWFYRFEQSGLPWEIVVDVSRLTMFINYRVLGAGGEFLGVAGVGLTLERVVELIDTYQRRFQRNIYFVDARRRIAMSGQHGGPDGAARGTALADVPGLADLNRQLPQLRPGSFAYESGGAQHFINIRDIPELGWFLMVEKQESSVMAPVRRALWINLLICFSVTATVLSLVGLISRRYLQRIETMATHDALTGLLNRHGFALVAGQAILETRRQQGSLCAVILDLDHFKQFNDRHGHLAGDFVLRHFAQLLSRQIRQSDLVSRWGGEEFVVLFKDTDFATAASLAERVRAATEAELFNYDGTRLEVTVSIGAARLAPKGTLEQMLREADEALYRAKNSGRNRVCLAAATHETAGTAPSGC
ncbi:sensor domain-containing diguanylate cyclase [Pseudomonas stutzeri]|uniref:diguanylate cyclase n=1 Tax=Stutzerimonas stutzeri TaxID=316 RepID=A0A2N8S5R7_STUST|nr:sensor domain-containing diguanylate cyclase [Stutzerimonas stutzeri]MCQ4296940.1 sensor domain-containing diguanylate cyclase [Stutzerimonas stutzeri]PNF81956.1 GGDEF domain-containing protein [Stutzerimonas stutzeri]